MNPTPAGFSRIVAIATWVIAGLVAIGWIVDVAALRSLPPGFATMKFNTALGFALAAGALWWVDSNRRIARLLAGSSVLLGLATLAQYLFGWQLGIDQLFVDDPYSLEAHPGRMSPASALNFVLLGASVLLIDSGDQRPTQSLALAAAVIAFMTLLGYLYAVPAPYGVPAFGSMALHTAWVFLLVAGGLLYLRPRAGLMKRVTGGDAGGLLIRRLVPAAICLPPAIGWLCLAGQRAGLFTAEFALVLLAVANVATFSAIVWWVARTVRRTDFARHSALQSLSANEAQLRTVLNAAVSGVIIIDARGVILDWNTRAEQMFGWSRLEALGRELVTTIIPEHYRRAHLAGLDRHTATGTGRVLDRLLEMSALRRDGTEFPVELSISAIGSGGTMRFCGFVTDITERKQAQVKLHAQLTRLSLLQRITRAIGERQDLDSIFQVVIRSLETDLPIDFGCVCLYEEAAEHLTVRRVGMRGVAVMQAMTRGGEARIELGNDSLARCLQGELVYEPELARVTSTFAETLVQAGLNALVVAPLKAARRVTGALVCARHAAHGFGSPDCEFLQQLSEHVGLAVQQVRLHEALQQAYDELRQSQQAVMQQERLRALGQMASGIAHDINNAISPVALYTESLLERERHLSAAARENLVTIQRAIDDVARTVARMREFYRPRESALEMVRVDLNELVEHTLELTRARWSDLPQGRGVHIRMEAALAELLPAVFGAESEIRDALTNLIFNAVDAMPQGGTLAVRTAAQGAVVSVEVGDTGVGMDEDTRRRCLEPFFTTKGERGTGLGLAMVYGMARRHGAELQIDSVPGSGTTVRVLFPATPQLSADEATQALRVAPQRPLRILVVDDDPLLLQSLSDIFESDGHRVYAADGGQAGIEAFLAAQRGSEPFDIVVTDLGMPQVDGRKVAAAVRAASARTPIVLLTGWGQRMVAENDVPAGVDRILSKPPSLQELRATLAELTAALGADAGTAIDPARRPTP